MQHAATNPCQPKPAGSVRMPSSELKVRHARCRTLLSQRHPEAGGLLIVSRPTIYYLTGTLGSGLFWLPLEGEPVLLLRKGCGRARLESPLSSILPFVSYRDVPALLNEAGSPLSTTVAVDKNSFSWVQADMLSARLPGISFVGGDDVLSRCMAVKSPWEQERMAECGRVHAALLDDFLPSVMHPGMSEAEIALLFASESLRLGTHGLCHMHAHGEEMFFGYVSCGTSSLYPTAYNGPLGCQGIHPATPFLGSNDVVWQKNQLCSTDMGCQKDGYHTDRTQCYWSGPSSTIPKELACAHEACVQILENALAKLVPGTLPSALWQEAQETAVRLGLRDGFMGLGRDQVPFLGHGIGICLDEWPAIAKSFNEPLEAGMTIALEPKISVPGLGMTGVEHTYLVTDAGPKSLTGGQMDLICLG